MEPPAPVNNADFRVVITNADGSTTSGHVVRVERGIDFYAISGFTDSERKTTVSLTGDAGSRDANWSDIQVIDIAYETDSSAVSCTYDSSVTPWAYICTLPSETNATTTDGERFEVTTRNVWRFTFASGETTELYLSKLPVRRPDMSGSGRRTSENPQMYVELRRAVLEAVTTAPTRIQINP